MSPYEESKNREKKLIEAIKLLAKKYNLGEIESIHGIDAAGNITLIQKSYGYSHKYPSPEIPKKLTEKALSFEGSNLGGKISNRWIKMNHFAWEKLLEDEGFWGPNVFRFLKSDIVAKTIKKLKI